MAAFFVLSLPAWCTSVAHQFEEFPSGHDERPRAVRTADVRICVVDAVAGRRLAQDGRTPLLSVAPQEPGATVLGVDPPPVVSVAVVIATVAGLAPATVCTEPSGVAAVEPPAAVVTPVRPPGVKVAGVAVAVPPGGVEPVAVPPGGVEPVAVTAGRTGAEAGTGMASTVSVAAVTSSGAVRAHRRMACPGVEIESGEEPPEDAATAPTSATAETTALRANRVRRTLRVTFRPMVRILAHPTGPRWETGNLTLLAGQDGRAG